MECLYHEGLANNRLKELWNSVSRAVMNLRLCARFRGSRLDTPAAFSVTREPWAPSDLLLNSLDEGFRSN